MPSKSIVIRHCIIVLSTSLFAFRSQLLNIESDLLSKQLSELLVDSVPLGKLRGQSMRTVSLVDVYVLILSIANFDGNRQEFLPATLTLSHLWIVLSSRVLYV